MSTATAKMPEYIYVSSNKRVRLILVDKSDGVIRVAGDVKSKSRPDIFHHARIEISKNGCIHFSCSCEAGAHGYLCRHVMELYNLFRKNAKNLLSQKTRLERGRTQ
jgi:hypothetical protein